MEDEKKKKILIIEDDVTMADMYKRIFERENFVVEVTFNGELGLQSAKKGGNDIIILDIMMPKMDGLDVLKKIKSDENIKPTPVIILTNLSNEAILTEAYELGASKYIIKSDISNEELVAKIKDYIASSEIPTT